MDMEFIQFHPTGMVWPPSVPRHSRHRGQCAAREASCATGKDAAHVRRHPRQLQAQTASDAEEGWRYTQGDKSARRPPELLTRDHVARCINREVKAAAGRRTAASSSTSRGSKEEAPELRGST